MSGLHQASAYNCKNLVPSLFVRLPATSRLILLALLLSLGIGGLLPQHLDAARRAWNNAERTNTNLVRALDRSIARTMEAFDQSLQGVVEGITDPRVMALPLAMRNLALLFDNSLRVQGVGSIWCWTRLAMW